MKIKYLLLIVISVFFPIFAMEPDYLKSEYYCSSTFDKQPDKNSNCKKTVTEFIREQRKACKKNICLKGPLSLDLNKYKISGSTIELANRPLEESRNGDSLIHFYVKQGSLEGVKFLREIGADINRRNNNGIAAIDILASEKNNNIALTASRKPNKKIFELLAIEFLKIHRVPVPYLSPLHYAAINGNCGALKALSSFIAKDGIYQAGSCTPLMLAAIKGRERAAKFLLKKNCFEQEKAENKPKLVHEMLKQQWSTFIIDLIKKNQVSTDLIVPISRDNGSLLHAAVIYDVYNLAIFLLKEGFKVNVRGFLAGKKITKRPPLYIACQYGRPKFVELFLENGAQADYCNRNFGLMPIHRAALSTQLATLDEKIKKGFECIRLFIENGQKIDVPTQTEPPQTCLDIIGEQYQVPLIQYCLENSTIPQCDNKEIREIISDCLRKKRRNKKVKKKSKGKKKERDQDKENGKKTMVKKKRKKKEK